MIKWHAVWPKKAHFPPYFSHFFDRSAATARRIRFIWQKNSHFFVSDATTPTIYNSTKSKFKNYESLLGFC
jgi:hypothetical protein